ncbi:LysR family transcriptional regulator [Achromobacter piechaudii]|uniref:HTH-type transcriptional regulator BenM n=1 Tax=Achromobacter piechaudii TaxID=72556 RepID=A0A6S7E328_9BURK|nr:LysR family transcriptional regulator [Achromobacter piechaudii]CAB3738783.1 HTH-type transcriptional regulator BenM [Achromobacter piechaudii]CAB3893824.1 HTH-type transcriptional regulator BenM [Achromobacter piechaudii]CAB3920289.1 HTH-type transcriptional regulator BenM [Achromobacter piechaudii]CAB3958603.1 HTH-type transcriptional regulator BenM [Achromobacter piechaudii]
MLDVKRLRYFVAVAEEQHFSRAAERLGISQPPLSEHVHALERELGVSLFNRTTRSVSLTEDGLNFLPHARRILSDIDQCGEVIRDARRRNMHTLRIGILHAHAYTFLPRLLAEWSDTHKDVRLTLVEHATQDQTAVVSAGTVDLAFVREPVHDADLTVTRVFSEPYYIALPQRWPTNAPDKVSIAELQDRAMIGFPSHHASSSTRALFRDMLIKHKVKTSDFLQVRTMHAALALVAAGQGFSPVPQSQSRLALYGVKYLPMAETPPQLSVGIARSHNSKKPLVRSFVDFCVAYFERGGW